MIGLEPITSVPKTDIIPIVTTSGFFYLKFKKE